MEAHAPVAVVVVPFPAQGHLNQLLRHSCLLSRLPQPVGQAMGRAMGPPTAPHHLQIIPIWLVRDDDDTHSDHIFNSCCPMEGPIPRPLCPGPIV